MTTRFTGFHMAAILVTFFAVVIGVNMTMAVLATRTFGGMVVDNSYVASQNFNNWLSQARKQQASGLECRLALDAQRRVVLTIAAPMARRGAIPRGHAEHPLGRADDVPLRFEEIGIGQFRSRAPIPAGRWILRVALSAKSGDLRFLEQVG
jgi:nitrogen fixation protein FixH